MRRDWTIRRPPTAGGRSHRDSDNGHHTVGTAAAHNTTRTPLVCVYIYTMACSLQRVALRGFRAGRAGSTVRHSGLMGAKRPLSYYHKGSTSGGSGEVDSDDELHPNWRWVRRRDVCVCSSVSSNMYKSHDAKY